MPRSSKELIRKAKRFAFVTVNSTTEQIYEGEALLGSATGATRWTIRRVTLVNGNPTREEWTGDGTAIWDNHLTEAYS